jgi:hypothetical protein
MMDVERILRSSPATVTMTFYNGSTPVNADGAVTVTVKKADGTTLATGSASGPTSNVYSYVIPAQANLNFLTITWSCTISSQAVTVTSYAEIVGGFLFSLSELRTTDTRLSDMTKFPDAKLIEERLSVEAEFEDITGRSFTPKFYREEYADIGDGYISLQRPEPSAVTKLTVDGVDRLSWVTSNYIRFDPSEPFVLNLTVEASSLLFASQVTIEYEYGMRQVPRKVRDAAIKRAKGNLLGQNSAIDERAVTVSTPEFGTMTLATPGRFGWETGIPDVDVVLERYQLHSSAGGVF